MDRRALVRTAGILLALAAAVALIAGVRRPQVLSSGSIALAVGVLSLIVFLLLFLSALGTKTGLEGFAFGSLDGFYAAAVAVSLASFLVLAWSRENFLQPFMLAAGFAAYLLVRTNRHRLRGKLPEFMAGGLAASGGLEAAHGLAQAVAGREMKGFFFNVNHLAMFLAMVLPVAWAVSRFAKGRLLRLSGYGLCALMLAAVGLSRCRTAYAALILVAGLTLLLNLRSPVPSGPGPRSGKRAVRRALAFLAAGFLVVSILAVSFKTMSAAGRLFVWKITVRTALAHPVAGVGYGNFAAVYNHEQGRYFREGMGSPAERIEAAPVAYAFNDYLESFMESGIIGLLVLIPFWILVLRTAVRALRRRSPRLVQGAAGSVLVYMITAAFYYPSRILPIALLFSGFLGWIAGAPRPAPEGVQRSGRRAVRAFAGISFAAALALFPGILKRFEAEQTWSEAVQLARSGHDADALAASRSAYPGLKTDADFVDFHAGLLLGAGEAGEAAGILEKATSISSHPRLAEKMAAARLELGLIDAAFKSAQEAEAVLPWRLTSKSLLAEICLRRGDLAAASRYARLVLETPMKVRTAEGEALKSKAFELWSGLRPRTLETGSLLLDLLPEVPAPDRGGVLAALQSMGSRSGPFVDALKSAGKEERAGFSFLLANMPDRDAGSLAPAFLMENVRTAFLARRTVPLASAVPEEVFLEYVLPYATADEPREAWRADFYRRFHEAAASSPSVEEAVVRLNREVVMQFRLVFADKNVRKPLVSLQQIIKRGFVSCGEASLLLVDACRSVGIPARLAVLPKYHGRPGGHIWVEAWDQGRWRHIAAYDPGYFDRTWIAPWVEKMFPPGSRGVIFAPVFRRTGIRAMASWDINFVDISENYLK